MANEVHNPKDKDGVPLHGPMADFVNKATSDEMRAQQTRFREEGRLRPDLVKASMRSIRENAIAEWKKDHPEDS